MNKRAAAKVAIMINKKFEKIWIPVIFINELIFKMHLIFGSFGLYLGFNSFRNLRS